MSRHLLPLALGVLALVALRAPAGAEEDPVHARRAFLESRDPGALAAALAGTAPAGAGAVTDARLVGLAASPDALEAPTGGVGYAAVPEVVVELRRLDLAAAEAALARVRQGPAPPDLDRWLAALLATRRGRDAEARRELRALAGPVELGEEDAFRLALLGAGLPEDDRLFLAGTGRAALLEAAAAGDLDGVERIGRRLAALDRRVGAGALCLVARALGRSGESGHGAAVLRGPESRWVESEACYRLERATWAWRAGRRDRAQRLVAGLDVPAALTPLVEAFRATATSSPPPRLPQDEVHVRRDLRTAHLVARLATDLGVPTTPAEVRARAVAEGCSHEDAGFVARFLAERDLDVRFAAGGDVGLRLALELGLPVLFLHIEPYADGFREVWRLIRGQDPATGLWIAQTGDLDDPGLLAPTLPREGRLLIAAPRHRASRLVAGIPPEEERLGRLLADAVDLADDWQLREAAAHVLPPSPAAGAPDARPFLARLYAAWFLYRRFLETRSASPAGQDRHALDGARKLLDGILDDQTRTAFVPFLVGDGLLGERSAKKLEAATAAFRRAQDLAPASAFIARARYQAHLLARQSEDAMAAIELARVLAPLDVVALYLRGRTRRKIGRTALARGDLQRASDRRPDWVVVAMELVTLEIAAGRPDVALRRLEELVARVPAVGTAAEAVRRARTTAEGMLVQRAESVEDLRLLLGSPQPQTRRRVAFTLARWETDASETLLRQLLHDADEGVRVTALRVYMRPWLRARVEEDPALGRLVQEILRSDASEMVRGAAAGLLGLVRASWAEAALAVVLSGPRRDAALYVRSEAAGALARHEGVAARRSLVSALEDPTSEVRRAAIDALFHVAATYRGYDPGAPSEVRAPAVRRWQVWVAKGER